MTDWLAECRSMLLNHCDLLPDTARFRAALEYAEEVGPREFAVALETAMTGCDRPENRVNYAKAVIQRQEERAKGRQEGTHGLPDRWKKLTPRQMVEHITEQKGRSVRDARQSVIESALIGMLARKELEEGLDLADRLQHQLGPMVPERVTLLTARTEVLDKLSGEDVFGLFEAMFPEREEAFGG